MDEQNILHRMLAKGDQLRDQYKTFDFAKLDQNQIKYINRLTFFSKHRERILKKFNGTRITYDVKIAYLDQHSMKLGNNIFYDLESKRQDYITSFDIMPFSTLFFGLIFFVGFAIKTPMTSKLYKEGVYSLLMGAGLSYLYVHRYKRIYLNFVDEIYEKLKYTFATNPTLSAIKEDEQIIKNFGLNRFADFDEEEPDEFKEPEPGIFEGTVQEQVAETKAQLINYFYGN